MSLLVRGVGLQSPTLGTARTRRHRQVASLRLQVVTPLTLTDERQLIVVLRVTALVTVGAFVLNPRGRLVQAVRLKHILVTTLFFFRKGGTLRRTVSPLHKKLTFAGLYTPRLEVIN